MTPEHLVALDTRIWAALDLEFLHALNFPLKTQMVQAKQMASFKLVSSLHCHSSQLRLQYLLGSSISLSVELWYQDAALDSCYTKQETSYD